MRKTIPLFVLMVLVGIATIADAFPIAGDSVNLTQSADLQTDNSYTPYVTYYCIITLDTFSFNQLEFTDFLQDYDPILINYSDPTSTASIPVPEPSSALLLLLGIFATVGYTLASRKIKGKSIGVRH